MLLWEKRRITLNYFYEITRIPVWIVKDNKLFYSSCDKGLLRDENEILKFLASLTNKASDIPQLMLLGKTELFAFFKFSEEHENLCFIAGPALNTHPAELEYFSQLSFDILFRKEAVRDLVLKTPMISHQSFCKYIQTVALEINDKLYDIQAFNANLKHTAIENTVDKELAKTVFDIREEAKLSVYSYDRECKYLYYVRNGDMDGLRKLVPFQEPSFRGAISAKTKKQFEYNIVAFITLIRRAAIEGGADIDTAFTLGEIYINRI